MGLFDLVFIAAFLATVGTVIWVLILAIRRRGRDARATLRGLGVGLAAYVAVLVGVSLAAPQRWVALGEQQRFDDWAMTVVAATHTSGQYRLTIQVTNRGRGRTQRAPDAKVSLVAADGSRIDARAVTGERSLGSFVAPGEAFVTSRDYDVADSIPIIGAEVLHGGGPGKFIIGDSHSFFHAPTLVRLK